MLLNHLRLNRVSNPKSIMTPPEILFSQSSQRDEPAIENLPRNRLIPPVSRNHQSIEPENTPPMTSRAANVLFDPPPTPRLAKMAAKEMIVSGLVRVSSNVET